ncbi:MAG: hypothetical protein KJN63_00920 [Acidimicrobiia bacterium]|nr:hypothetical protein [Acidimicrobiia bacterium]
MKTSTAVLLLVILIAAGCSSEGDGRALVPTTVAVSSTTSTLGVPSTSEPPEPADAVTSDPEEEAPSTTTATPTEPEVAIEEVVADRIRGYFAARETANAAPAPNPDDPLLAEFAVSEELAAVTANTQTRLNAGQAIRPGEQGLADIRVGFVDAGASAVKAAACAIDDGVIFDVATGAVVNDDVVTHNYQINLELHDGVWKLSRIVRVQQWEGVAGCALSPADYPF